MRVGELFSGYGGLGMGVQSVLGGDVVWHSDIDRGACKILAHRYPDVPNLGDITTVDWSQVEPVDVLTGGSPCQDLSHAGRRAGMSEGTRSNLWVAMREAIAALRPPLVVWENVRGAYSAGADSELETRPGLLGSVRRRDGEPVLRALGRVLGDLSDLGYDAQWHGLRAADVGAPHGRFRVFLLATARDADDAGLEGHWLDGERAGERAAGAPGAEPAAADAADVGHERGGRARYGWAGLEDSRGWTLPRSLAGLTGSGPLLPTPNTGESLTGHGRRGGRPGNGNQSGASLDQIAHLLPTPTSADSKASGAAGYNGNEFCTLTDVTVRGRGYMDRPHDESHWGDYAAAIARWETVLGRTAPPPTMTSAKGNPQLSPRFVEWMMGLPAGWVADVPGITRNEALRALGNGVVPQQCAAALRLMLGQGLAA